MKYLGGKHKIGKEISTILKDIGKKNNIKTYIEPFCGSLGVMKHMTEDFKCKASDNNKDIITMWKDVKNNKLKYPTNITKKKWKTLKKTKKKSALKTLVGYGTGFSGRYYIGFCPKNTKRNYFNETKKSVKKIGLKIRNNVQFSCKDYRDINLKNNNNLIYCDPPYMNTRSQKNWGTFNHYQFWDTMRKWSKNNIVVISEQNAPEDFNCIWEKNIRRSLGRKFSRKGKDVEEKLFIHKSFKL